MRCPKWTQLPVEQDGACPGIPVTQMVPKSPVLGYRRWDLSCSAQKALAAAQILPALGNKGRGEVSCLTWEWDTSWCVVSFSINCNKAKTETWQWFCSRDAAAGCSVLFLLQLVSTEQLLRMSGTPKVIPLCAVSCLWDSATFLISRKQPCQACSKEQESMVWWPQLLG